MNAELRAWYRDKRVFVTGHTGFKGAWLTSWLRSAGAEVTAYGLPPPAGQPSLFEAAGVAGGIDAIVGDVRDRTALDAAFASSAPELVFHLAAQSLVRRSYREPIETYTTNVIGTANVLDACRHSSSIRGVVVVTSDKCYENHGFDHAYAEDDPMGGYDPYSSSKGCAELVTAAMRRSFLHEQGIAVASVRAGNVIGGGDFSEDRLVPDVMKAASAGERAVIRQPDAVRPWQFVLEPLRGYLTVGRALLEDGLEFGEAWNFGPREGDSVPVREVTKRMAELWDRVDVELASVVAGPHEASVLKLDNRKARDRLGWAPVLTLDETVDLTVAWYRAFHEDARSAPATVASQLAEYERLVTRRASG